MPRGERSALTARGWAALLVLIALVAMARLAPSSATFSNHSGSEAIRSVVGAARQPEAVVERASVESRVLSSDLDAAAVPRLVGLSLALWAMLAVSGLARDVRSRAGAVLRLRGPPALTS
jgi:hypothetical protein